MNTRITQKWAPSPGMALTLLATVLFGASVPFARHLLGKNCPVLFSGLLGLGSGLGLALLYVFHRCKSAETPLTVTDLPWLAGTAISGGVAGPALLMYGLAAIPAATAALLVSLIGVFTILVAWLVFHEKVDRRSALAAAFVAAGAAVLLWQGVGVRALLLGLLAIVGACVCWGIQINLLHRLSARSPLMVGAIVGVSAGTANLCTALVFHSTPPSPPVILGALLTGFLGYGLGLLFLIQAVQQIGPAGAAAYFAPGALIGAAVSLLLLREPAGVIVFAAAALIGIGSWLHLKQAPEMLHGSVHYDHTQLQKGVLV